MRKPEKSLVDSIHRTYPDLSTRERAVADLVLEAPGDLSACSASELAELAGVSNSTVTRFVQRLGFENYEEARRSARDAREWGSPLFLAIKATPKPDRPSPEKVAGHRELLATFAEIEAGLLTETLAKLSPDRLDEITDALASASRLYFMGFRNSYYLAGYARWQFIQCRPHTHLFPGPGETVAERLAELGKGDLVVIVGMRRVVGKLRHYLEAIADTEADVLLLTDPSARHLPARARWTITCPVENPYVFDSYAGVLAVLRLLAFETFQKLGKPGRAYLQRVECHHERLGEFE